MLVFAASQSSLIGASSSLLHDLGATPAQYGWALSGNLVTTAVVTPLAGRLGDMTGHRRILLGSAAVAAAGGLVGVLFPGIVAVIAARVLQGLGGGMLPLAVGIARRIWADRPRRGAWLATCVSVGGGAGPAVGGVLSDLGGYRLLLLAISVTLAVSAACVLVTVPRSPATAPGRIDVPGLLLLSALVVGLLLVLSQGAARGWASAPVLLTAAGAVAAGTAFVQVERRTAAPLISVAALRGTPVALTCLATAAVGAVSFAALVLGMRLAQAAPAAGGQGAGAATAGLLLLPGSAAVVVCAAGAARITRLPDGAVLAVGGLLAGTGLVVMSLGGGPLGFVGGSVLASAGVGTTFAPLSALADGAADSGRRAEAQGLNTLLRIVGSAVGGQMSVALLGDALRPDFGPPLRVFAGVAMLAVVAGCGLATRPPRAQDTAAGS